MIEFIFLNRELLVRGGVLLIGIGLPLLAIPSDRFKSEILEVVTFTIGLITSSVGAILLGYLISVSLYSKEYTVMKILKQKPNLKKEYLMKYDLQFLHNVLDELDVKKEEKKQKEIQEIINQ